VDATHAQVAFIEREHPRLVGALSLYCGDADLAEEVAQEALARACRDWSRVASMRSPGAWTHRVAINLVNSWFRRRAAERRARARHGVPPEAAHEVDRADIVAIRHAVAALPPRQRAAVVLRYYADLPVAEAAAVLGCAEGTVKALTHRGLTALRRAFAEDTEEVRDAC
jgi:RNA polymerase sigma-70 factor (sigma-E family)